VILKNSLLNFPYAISSDTDVQKRKTAMIFKVFVSLDKMKQMGEIS